MVKTSRSSRRESLRESGSDQKGADWTEKRREEVKVHFAEWISVEHRKEVCEWRSGSRSIALIGTLPTGLSTMPIQYWVEGVWTGKWSHEQKEAWMRQVREVQTWKQVRGPAGAVMCETCDLRIKKAVLAHIGFR